MLEFVVMQELGELLQPHLLCRDRPLQPTSLWSIELYMLEIIASVIIFPPIAFDLIDTAFLGGFVFSFIVPSSRILIPGL